MPPSIACITKPEPFEVSTCPDEPGELKPVPPYPAATAVTNLEYEEAEQDKKRKIKLLDPSYLDLFSKEYTKLMSESVF